MQIRVWTIPLIALLATPLWGQEEGRPDPAALFDRLDANKDGLISEDEVPQESRRMLQRLLRTSDKNNDGKLSKEEFAAGLAERPQTQPEPGQPGTRRPGAPRPGAVQFDREEIFKRMDRNGDGKITEDELPQQEFLQRMVKAADTNRDGVVTKEEYLSFRPMPGTPARPSTAETPGGADSALLRALDTDGDGVLSAEEISGAGSALKKLDRNGDGKITRDELAGPGRRPTVAEPAATRPAATTLPDRFKELDKNNDGKISKEEAPERLREFFDRVDTNGNGFLEPEELQRLAGPRPMAGNPADMLKELDKNGDGKLSKEELPERMREFFERLDADNSGFVELEELRRIGQGRPNPNRD